MKTTPILNLLVSASLLAGASAQLPDTVASSAEEVGLLPAQKSAEAAASRVVPDTRNPFASRTKSTGGPVVADQQTEESRIRAVLEKFIVNGTAKADGGGYSAQAKGLILREGELLPHLLKDQVDDLRVTKVTPRLVEITWVGDEDATQPRQISLPIDMTATVAVVLPTPEKGSGGPVAIIGADRMEEGVQ